MKETMPGFGDEEWMGGEHDRAEMAEKHSSEVFYAMDDPLETTVFSALVEMLKEMDKADCGNGENEIETASLPQPYLNL
jgi:hypothetical protein